MRWWAVRSCEEERESESGFHSVGSRSALKAWSSGGFEVRFGSVEGILAGRMRGAVMDSASEPLNEDKDKDGDIFGEVPAILTAVGLC